MSPHFFYSPSDISGASNIVTESGRQYITVAPNCETDPSSQEVFLGISMDFKYAGKGEAWGGVDANELRDAIDKAVGKEGVDWRDSDRVEVDWPEGRIVIGRETVGKYAGQWVFPSGLHYRDAAVARLHPKAVPASTPKPYRPVDRDRLLRHIEDLQATLTRRNERHEQDQERIRELEAEVGRMEIAKNEAEHREGQLRTLTAREYLQMAFDAAIVPEDGLIHEGERFLCKDGGTIREVAYPADSTFPTDRYRIERRLLEPRPEPTPEEKREALIEEHGLEEWEVQLLTGTREAA